MLSENTIMENTLSGNMLYMNLLYDKSVFVFLGVFIPEVCVCAGFPYQVGLVRRHSVSRVN